MGLLQFPNELLTNIAGYLTIKEISNFCRSSRDLHAALDSLLYRRVRGDADVLQWAIRRGITQTVRKLLQGGTSPDPYMLDESRHRIQIPGFSSGLDYQMQLYILEQQNRRRLRIMTEWGEDGFQPLEQWMTAIHLAASLGYDDIIELLLDYGATVNALSQDFCKCDYRLEDHDARTVKPWWMPLHTAICHGNYATARLLVARGASFQIAPRAIGSSSDCVTALHLSCYIGALELSRFLLESYHPQIDTRDHQGLTPLAWAYMSRQWDTIEWLVQNGANIDANIGNGRSLLWDACFHRQLDEAHRLLELGANPRYYIGTSPLHYCCSESNTVKNTDQSATPSLTEPIRRLALAKRLVEAGADVNAQRPLDEATPLSLAAAAGSTAVVEYLLEAGALIDSQDVRGQTPLMKACSLAALPNVWLPTIKLLLQRGASTILMDNENRTALELFCESRKGHPDEAIIIGLLIEYGSPPNATSDSHLSLIHSFFMSNNLDISRYLQTVGTKLPTQLELMEMLNHAITNDDANALRFTLQLEGATELLCTETRLFDALDCCHNNVAEIIFDAGAPWTYTKWGATCLFCACRIDNVNLVRKLLAVGADPNCFTDYGESPLAIAIEYGNVAIFGALLDHGAEPFPSSINTYTLKPRDGALLRAILRGKVEIVDVIMKRGLYNSASAAEQIRSMYLVCNQKPSPVSLALLRALLSGGADPNMRLLQPSTANYCLPLQVVMAHENQEAADLLHSYGATPLPQEASWHPPVYAADSLQ
ncbi:ankyrin [Hypoxylon sp. NC0597]|nr:ankyrin [Hypoxylon sp. NC0597]